MHSQCIFQAPWIQEVRQRWHGRRENVGSDEACARRQANECPQRLQGSVWRKVSEHASHVGQPLQGKVQRIDRPCQKVEPKAKASKARTTRRGGATASTSWQPKLGRIPHAR